jgi:hypothetical protein
MPTLYNIRATSTRGPLEETREAKVGIFTDSIMIDLARPGKDTDDKKCPRVYIEWKPNDGWYVYMSNGHGEPELISRFTDRGMIRYETRGALASW